MVSINNTGKIAFVGVSEEGTAVYITESPGNVHRVSFAPEVNRDFGQATVLNNPSTLNNTEQAVARENRNGNFVVRRWINDSQHTVIASTSNLLNSFSDPEDYEGLVSFVDVNDNNEVVYLGVDTDFATVQQLRIRISQDEAASTIELGDFPAGAGIQSLRPQISNTTEVVFRSHTGQSIVKSAPPHTILSGTSTTTREARVQLGRIAGNIDGFTNPGLSPGITDDGTAVAFYAEGPDGPGIWLSVLRVQGDRRLLIGTSGTFAHRQLIQVAGLTDELGSGMQLQHFRADARVGVGGKRNPQGDSATVYYVTYIAEEPRTGEESLWRSQIVLRNTLPTPPESVGSFVVTTRTAPQKVAGIGETLSIHTATSEVTRSITALEVYDPINNRGDIGFWVTFTNGHKAVLRAPQEPPKVVNVLTHGFGRVFHDPVFGDIEIFSDFLDPWYRLGTVLERLPQPGSDLEGQVASYVANWDSSDGWVPALAHFSISLIFSAASLLPNRPPIYGPVADIANALGRVHLERAGFLAKDAAQKIVQDLRQGLLGDPQLSRNDEQIIHLIGHSRGAAVNAQVAQLLSEAGYTIHQYTALDGYSIDWPHGSGFLGDIDIAAVADIPRVERRVNYLVEQGLERFIDQALLPYLHALSGLINSNASGFTPQLKQLLEENYEGIKAPLRDGFENRVLLGMHTPGEDDFSNHLNIGRLYTTFMTRPEGQQYLLDNYLGQHLNDGLLAPQPLLVHATQDAVSTTLSGTTPQNLLASPRHDFLDGSFEELGVLYAQIMSTDFPDLDDDLIRAWIALVKHPTTLVGARWQVTGDVQLTTEDGNTSVTMTQSSHTSLGQFLDLDESTGALAFDLTVVNLGRDGRLEVYFMGQLLASYSLQGLVDGRYTISTCQLTGQSGDMTFVLAGTEGRPAAIRLDNFAILPGNCQVPFRVFDNGIEVAEGATIDLGTTRQGALPLRQTLTIHNTSVFEGTLSDVRVTGEGYTVLAQIGTAIPPNVETEITVILLAEQTNVTTHMGMLSVTFGDQTIHLALTGQVLPPLNNVSITLLEPTTTGQTRIGIDFPRPLDSATASISSNYSLITEDNREIAIASAEYSSSGTIHRTTLTLTSKSLFTKLGE